MAALEEPGLGPNLERAAGEISARYIRSIRRAGVATNLDIQREHTIGRQWGR